MIARLRAAFAEGQPLWYVAAFLIVIVAPAVLTLIAFAWGQP
jgi:hypothetical protein